MAEFLEHNAANGVELLFVQLGFEEFVKVVDGGDRLHGVSAIAAGLYVGFLVEVMFVFDFSHDLFQHILNGDQAGCTTVFVNHNGHVVAGFLELF